MQNKIIVDLITKVKAKIKPGITISTAESCTGGMFAYFLTTIPGSSAYFSSGIISYSNDSKIELLHVNKETIETFGAVSEETAVEMAIGSKIISKSDIAISITGIAGPDGGSEDKPVGTVCFGVVMNNNIASFTQHFSGRRSSIRASACIFALELILDRLV
jgi:PncC family amidohydrolase